MTYIFIYNYPPQWTLIVISDISFIPIAQAQILVCVILSHGVLLCLTLYFSSSKELLTLSSQYIQNLTASLGC